MIAEINKKQDIRIAVVMAIISLKIILLAFNENWIKGEEQSDSISFYPTLESASDNDPEEFSIVTFPSESKTLQQIINDITKYNGEQNKDTSDFHLIESKPIVLKDGHAHKLIFTYQDPEFGNLKTMITVLIRDSRTYEIAYHSHPQNYSTYVPIVQKMIDSFEIIK